MIVERVPDFLSSPKISDVFLFDQNGRFIYVYRCTDEPAPIFLLYDSMFNNYVELKADSTFQNANTLIPNGDVFLFLADSKTCVVVSWDWSPKIQLYLLHFDLVQKTYSLVDQLKLTNCESPELIGDPNRFGLFYTQICQDGRWANEEIGEELNVFVVQMFTSDSDKIVFLEKKELGYSCYGQPSPKNLHLCGQKLWFVRESKFPRFIPHTSTRPLSPDLDYYMCISYFDLNEECPQEVLAGTIKEERYVSPTWTLDSLVIQLTSTKFRVFDLKWYEWSNVESRIPCSDLLTFGETAEWVLFSTDAGHRMTLNHYLQLACDQGLNLTAVDGKTGNLHRVELKEPFKLIELAWTCALNTGLLDKLSTTPEKLPYSRIF